MTVGTPLWAFVPRPNVLRIGIPVPPGWFPKEGPLPFLWSFQGGSGREIEIPPGSFSFASVFFWRRVLEKQKKMLMGSR